MSAQQLPGAVPSCTGDDHPREGCIATVDVTRDGYSLTFFSQSGERMSSYRAVRSARELARLLQEWAEGKMPQVREHEGPYEVRLNFRGTSTGRESV